LMRHQTIERKGRKKHQARSQSGRGDDRILQAEVTFEPSIEKKEVLESAGIDLIPDHILGQEKKKMGEEKKKEAEREDEITFEPEKGQQQEESGKDEEIGLGGDKLPPRDGQGYREAISRSHRLALSRRTKKSSAASSR